jgi:hypothetical protein
MKTRENSDYSLMNMDKKALMSGYSIGIGGGTPSI